MGKHLPKTPKPPPCPPHRLGAPEGNILGGRIRRCLNAGCGYYEMAWK